MSSILGKAGATRIYNTDGTGRDTYIHFNMGGNTTANFPTQQAKGGGFTPQKTGFAPQNVARAGAGGSPAKRLHYHVNGTGRDTYIHSNHGGFMTNYGFKKDYDSYVENLRGYHSSAHG